MYYDDAIRIQSSINAKYLREMTKTANYLNKKLRYEALSSTTNN